MVAAAAARADAPPQKPPQAGGIALPRAAPPLESRALELRVDGVVVGKITSADFAKVKPMEFPTAIPGGRARLCAMRDAVELFAGAGARVVAVAPAEGPKLALDEKAWADGGRIPVLWQNRRGLFKVGFVDKNGNRAPGAPELRDVLYLDVVKAAAH